MKPSIGSRMVALAVACVTGTLLLSWATAEHAWMTYACGVLLLASLLYLGMCDVPDDNEKASRPKAGHN